MILILKNAFLSLGGPFSYTFKDFLSLGGSFSCIYVFFRPRPKPQSRGPLCLCAVFCQKHLFFYIFSSGAPCFVSCSFVFALLRPFILSGGPPFLIAFFKDWFLLLYVGAPLFLYICFWGRCFGSVGRLCPKPQFMGLPFLHRCLVIFAFLYSISGPPFSPLFLMCFGSVGRACPKPQFMGPPFLQTCLKILAFP